MSICTFETKLLLMWLDTCIFFCFVRVCVPACMRACVCVCFHHDLQGWQLLWLPIFFPVHQGPTEKGSILKEQNLLLETVCYLRQLKVYVSAPFKKPCITTDGLRCSKLRYSIKVAFVDLWRHSFFRARVIKMSRGSAFHTILHVHPAKNRIWSESSLSG